MTKELLKKIPNKNFLLNSLLLSCSNRALLSYCIDEELNNLRKKILNGNTKAVDSHKLIQTIHSRYKQIYRGTIIPVINATGVVLHTNLGRAPISEEIFENIKKIVTSYSNLEYDIKKGERGDRYHHVAEYLKILTGAEDALIVNNNASAVFLILNTFGKSKNVLVSRGELVEIGGNFRIPEVMVNSGAKLKEIGTTNKTKLRDYEENIDDKTAILMKVHKSNYNIVGFAEDVNYKDIAKLAKDKNIISYYDLGSGFLSDIFKTLCNEPTLKEVVESGIDLVSASGDKLIGSVQCGIILGKKILIDKLKKNQLLRMLRVDKVTLAFLQETFKSYIEADENKIKSLNLFNTNSYELTKKAEKLKSLIGKIDSEIVNTKTYIGGGSCPLQEVDSIGLIIHTYKAKSMEKRLREFETPVICRKGEDHLLFDMMAILEDEIETLAEAINWAKM
ncbi:L-seryl-tRNA(Sec) selenium transferase [Deferribacteraceae bacterium V6Fe1]|nr:L-seryl-tRNA(Sec) selenium transferase [Deferribacteraceae bacterium V6Fe1]